MIIHCAASEKLFYMDETPPRKECPICGSSKANYLSTTVVFGADAPEEGATAPLGHHPKVHAAASIQEPRKLPRMNSR